MNDNAAGLGVFALFLLLGIGWVMNIMSLISSTEATGLMIARGIGIFVAPLGAFLGWFV